MRAVTLSEFGGPEVLSVSDVPHSAPSPDEVRVRVAAAAVNPTDILLRKGAQKKYLRDARPPYIPGMDFAGTIESIGSDVVGIDVGDRVIGALSAWRPTGGAQAELVTVPAVSVTTAPAMLDMVEASTLAMNGLTADASLSMLRLSPGDSVAVIGAAGAVGGLAVELAVARGLTVIAVAGTQDHNEIARMGAHYVVERGEDAFDAIRELVPDGVDGLIDAANIGNAALPAVRDHGRVIRMMPDSDSTEREIEIDRVFVIDHLTDTVALERIRDLADQGRVSPRIAEVLPAEQVALAHTLVEDGGVRGRVVLTF